MLFFSRCSGRSRRGWLLSSLGYQPLQDGRSSQDGILWLLLAVQQVVYDELHLIEQCHHALQCFSVSASVR
jgi:hypothetical protein